MACLLKLLPFATVFVALVTRGVAEWETCAGGNDENEGGASCNPSREAPSSSSLLQKTFRSVERHGLWQQESGDRTQVVNCTGVEAQGRCWHLSERAESCASTCARNGLNFSYAAAGSAERVMPRLVGHEPVTRQGPWVAFECYVPSEDRYHSANANAAKHQDNLATWSREECKLACPCVNLGSNSTLPDKDTNDTCQWRPAASCVKEFDYEGTHHVGCVTAGQDIPWCSKTTFYTGYPGSWTSCVYSCATKQEQTPKAARNPSADPENVTCTWKQPPNCSESFVYKGVNHTGCVDVDHPTPWCSHDRVHQGSWASCERVCTPVSPVVQPTASPTSKPGAPCARHPEAENDAIGNLATLDESGYKITVAANSPINLKRFVCRVVDKINCHAIDYPMLMAYVHYYSGSYGKQTFGSLEAELTTLCRDGSIWVVPLDRP